MMQDNETTLPPFPAFPSADRYVALGAIEEAMTRVGRAINAREPAALVIGPPGTGKSLLARLVARQYAERRTVVMLGDAPLENREALLRHLLHQLGVDCPGDDPHLALVDFLNQQPDQEAGLLVIVDEAHTLSAEVIEAIRMVTNITGDGQPRVFALLCGGPKLDETLVDSSLESFAQRAATRCYLHPLSAEETRQYIHETIAACGADPESTVTAEAVAAVHHGCSGVPRLINQLMTEAIDCAADADQSVIDESIIDRAWAQLQQLPSPMLEAPEPGDQSASIEFGELESHEESIKPRDDRETVAAGVLHEPSVGDELGNEGIALESPSASWVDEPAADVQPHDIEPASVGPAPLELFGQFDQEETIAVGSGFATQPDLARPAPADLESLLQEEIVAAGPAGQHFADDLPGCERAPTVQLHRLHDDEAVCRDDSDLLVIEDDVDVLPMDWSLQPPQEGHEVSVDFQSILSKMRGVE